MPPTPNPANHPQPLSSSRRAFLNRSAQGLGALAVMAALPAPARAQTTTAVKNTGAVPQTFDLREFVRWITAELEPSVHLPGGAGHYAREPGKTTVELYGVSDMACILYSIGALRPTERERAEWAEAFQSLQNPDTGWLLEKEPSHTPLHNTAFALGAMELLNLTPKLPVKMGPEYADPAAFLETLDWKTAVYTESHKGVGFAAIHALVPELRTAAWFQKYFAKCDSLFDPHNGLMGRDKPATGDSDQIGGTFHYSFMYTNFNRFMPYPEQRIDTVLRLQQPDGFWRPDSHLWMTLDAVYLMTRTLRYTTHRFDDVRDCVRRVMAVMMEEIYSPAGRKKSFTGRLTVHSVTAAINFAAEAQQFLGAQEVITDLPLRLVLDRRPFI